MQERYKQFKQWLIEEQRTVKEVYSELHKLFDENNEEDRKFLNENATNDELYVFYH